LDGFRSIVFRDGDQVEIGSRNERPMTRYFPNSSRRQAQPPGEVRGRRRDRDVLDDRLEFGLRQRIHRRPARPTPLGRPQPASWPDLLAVDNRDYTGEPFATRRAALEEVLRDAQPPVHLTPTTRDHDLASEWFAQFEGAGLDGVVAKPLDGTYEPDKRVMFKIKHQRTADCVVAGYRVHKTGPDSIGSLLLGLYNDDGDLVSVGVIGAFPLACRKELFTELQPLVTTFDDHPWAWARQEEGARTPRASEFSRWNTGKDLSFVPLRPERVEVATSTWRASGSGTPHSSTGGVRTAIRGHAPTSSSRSRSSSTWPRCSAPDPGRGPVTRTRRH
jgi:ATP-dependent DNA ligase